MLTCSYNVEYELMELLARKVNFDINSTFRGDQDHFPHVTKISPNFLK